MDRVIAHPPRLWRCLPALALGLVLQLGAGATASAEPYAPRGERDPRLSGSVFLGGNYFSRQIELGNSFPADQTPGSSPLLGARVGYLLVPELLLGSEVRPRLHVEVEAKLATSSTRGDAEAGRPSFFAPVFGWRAQGRVDFWPHRELTPFAVAGVGGETFFSRSPWAHSPDTDGAVLWGLGATYDLNARAGLRADLRQGITAGRSQALTATYEVHAGFFMRFGEPSPQIERRIFVEGEPPGEAQERAQDEDMNAAPDEGPGDSDENAQADPAPSSDDAAEAGEDAAAEAGEDAAAEAGEDAAAPQSRDRAKGEDKPAEPEGERESDPSTEPEEAARDDRDRDSEDRPDRTQETLAELAEGVRFEIGSADLAPESREHLDEMASLLDEHPDLRVEISGHTDSQGPRSLNVMLSHARARQVVRYLVGRGIERERLEAVGHGPDRPIAGNDTADGRAENRRIEIRVLSRDGEA